LATQETIETEPKTILESVKAYISDAFDDSFDDTIAMALDGYLADLNMIGAGKLISVNLDRSLTWDDFFVGSPEDANKALCIQYVNIRTKIEFDPPQPSALSAMSAQADKFLWYARLAFDKT
jgi:hypothetical protein